jgi:heme exporter protein CcmD
MSAFLHMGGYARFVWPSYALTFAILIMNIAWARRALARARDLARGRLVHDGALP